MKSGACSGMLLAVQFALVGARAPKRPRPAARENRTMSYRAWFQCINPQCGATYPLNSVVYQCERCHALLEVQHDHQALARRSAAAWMRLFEERYKSTQWPFGSGVWGKKEWILPQIDNENIVSLYEGGTNLFWAERFGKLIGVKDLWVKLCGNTHSGSFKDLGMTVLVSQVKQMIAEGAPIKAVACASTGDTSAALATYCAAAGIQSVVLLPRGKISIAQLIGVRAGQNVQFCELNTCEGGDNTLYRTFLCTPAYHH